MFIAIAGVVAGSVLASGTVEALDDAPPPSSTESAVEGVGYGGTSDWLLVETVDGRVHLRGGGFQADSDVVIEIGGRLSTVRADDLGNVDVWLEISGDELIVASGVGADGSSRVIRPSDPPDDGSSSPQTALALALGAAGAWLLPRSSRRHATSQPRGRRSAAP